VNESPTPLAERIENWLPQTQCRRCGYPDCRAYAAAVADGEADLNRCPPGGEPTIAALAGLLGRAPQPLDPACGPPPQRAVACIEEALCIGCLKCLEACPVDAIVGARKLLHTVIAAECNGCGLCLPPCPMDCIQLLPVTPRASGPWPQYGGAEAERWRRRHAARGQRLARRAAEAAGHVATAAERERRRAEIRAAVERVRARRAERAG
jgi:electron transport complex protein RnfB